MDLLTMGDPTLEETISNLWSPALRRFYKAPAKTRSGPISVSSTEKAAVFQAKTQATTNC